MIDVHLRVLSITIFPCELRDIFAKEVSQYYSTTSTGWPYLDMFSHVLNFKFKYFPEELKKLCEGLRGEVGASLQVSEQQMVARDGTCANVDSGMEI